MKSTKDNWIKAFESLRTSPTGAISMCLSDDGKTKEMIGANKVEDLRLHLVKYFRKEFDIAIEKTNKRWESKPPEIKTELPFSATINGVPHVLTSISEQNFASILRGATPDGKITLTFTKSDLLGDKK